MGRPKSKPPELHSKMAGIRLRDQEWAGLKQLAENLNETPSRIIRRLIREAVTGGPDYFDDGLLDLRRMARELNSIGRNLNQLSRAANQGAAVGGDDVRRVINAGIVQMEAVRGLYLRAVRATVNRAMLPLYEEAGLTLTQREPGQDQARTRPGRVLDPDHGGLNRTKIAHKTSAPSRRAAPGGGS